MGLPVSLLLLAALLIPSSAQAAQPQGIVLPGSTLFTQTVAIPLTEIEPPLVYTIRIQVAGDDAFKQRVGKSLKLLSDTFPLNWWLVWASEYRVSIWQSDKYAMFSPEAAMTAHGNLMVIVIHPPGQTLDATTTALAFLHEIRHLMQYPDPPDEEETQRDWEMGVAALGVTGN